MSKIVILGGGLTGLSAAYHLERKGFTNYVLFEKESELGGLCRSMHQDGFTFDYTGHLLHINDPYMATFIEDIVGLSNMNAITRRSYIRSNNTFTNYPFQVNLYGLPPQVIADCIEGYVKRPANKKVVSFSDWVLKHFGAGLARHFFTPFQSKILAHNPREITASWTGRFVPKTSLRTMIEGALTPPTEQAIGYNSSFYYPREGGIFFWVEKLIQTLKQPARLNHCVSSIDMKNKVVTFTNGHHETFTELISTIPLDIFLKLCVEKSSTTLKRAQKNLLCNSVVNFNCGVNRDDLSDKHWIYFPEKKYPFYRLGFPHNFAKSMAPEGCSSLYGEFSHVGASQASINYRIRTSLKKTRELFNIKPADIITEKIVTIPHAYVLYTFWREKNLPKLLKTLEQQSVYSIGRYGGWKYSSMQEAILDGKKIADQLVLTPAVGAPAVGTPAVGIPAVGAPAVGTPAVGIPAVGATVKKSSPTKIITPQSQGTPTHDQTNEQQEQ